MKTIGPPRPPHQEKDKSTAAEHQAAEFLSKKGWKVISPQQRLERRYLRNKIQQDLAQKGVL